MWLFLLQEQKQSWAIHLIDVILILHELPALAVQTACDLSGVSKLNSVHSWQPQRQAVLWTISNVNTTWLWKSIFELLGFIEFSEQTRAGSRSQMIDCTGSLPTASEKLKWEF